ncbi:MAG: hypothetical protein L0Y57_14570 [Beijerinckiaceae bacterium]|nr:hypothetical protein [Beijerinckiaceae bacterium]
MFPYKTRIVLAAAILAFTAAADAQTNRNRRQSPIVDQYASERPPLTVTKRSWLDPGPVVPVGTMSNYVTMNTVFARTPDQVFAKSWFQNDILPQPLEVPGRPSPVFEFSTPAYPD